MPWTSPVFAVGEIGREYAYYRVASDLYRRWQLGPYERRIGLEAGIDDTYFDSGAREPSGQPRQ